MSDSEKIREASWRLFVALRVAFVVLGLLGIALLLFGNFYGIFVLMLGGVLGHAAAFRRCTRCNAHVGWVGPSWFGVANPLVRHCSRCGHRIGKT